MRLQSAYLRDILRRIDMIEEFTQKGQEDFLNFSITQEGTIRCFEVIGEIIKRLDHGLLARQSQTPWRHFSVLGDMLVEQYYAVNVVVVWDTVKNDLPPLKAAVQAPLASLSEEQPDDEAPEA